MEKIGLMMRIALIAGLVPLLGAGGPTKPEPKPDPKPPQYGGPGQPCAGPGANGQPIQLLSQGPGTFLIRCNGKVHIHQETFDGGHRCCTKLVWAGLSKATYLGLPHDIDIESPTDIRVWSYDRCTDDGKGCDAHPERYGASGWPKGYPEGATSNGAAVWRISGDGHDFKDGTAVLSLTGVAP